MATNSDITFHVGEDKGLTFTAATATACAGWTFALYVRRSPDGVDLVTLSTGFTITDAVNGVITNTLLRTATLGLPLGDYFYEFRRVDSGHNTVLAYGVLTLLP